jgi:hypothetical protein
MGNSSFFNNPNDYQTVDEGGEGSGFYDGPAYTQIDPVAIANSVAAAAASAADAAAHDASATAHDASSASHDTNAAAAAAAALVSQNAAAASAADALTQKNAAVTAAGVSVDAAGVATDQATIATTQAGIATTKAGEAATSATIAGSQATTATTQAGIATTKAGEAATSASNAATSAANAASAVQSAAGTASPAMDGSAAVGVSTKWAHEDHVHPTDTSRAPLASPAFTGTPTAPTPTAGDNSTKLSTTAFVAAAIAALVNASPSTLDTLNELAAALGNDPNFATTVSTSLGLKAPLASPALTGTPTAPTPANGDNTTKIATTAFGGAAYTLKGDTTTPANVILTNNAAGWGTFYVPGPGPQGWSIQGFRITASGSNSGAIFGFNGAVINYANIEFGACGNYHVWLNNGSFASMNGNCNVVATGTNIHWLMQQGCRMDTRGMTLTLTGTPAFATTFCQMNDICDILCSGMTFSGAATGSRFVMAGNSVINSSGAAEASYFPGNVAGTKPTGSLWI